MTAVSVPLEFQSNGVRLVGERYEAGESGTVLLLHGGGQPAGTARGEHLGLARGLVLVDIVVKPDRAGTDRILAFMSARPEGFASLEEVAEAIEAYNPVRRRARNLEDLKKNVRLGEDGRWRWHWTRRSRPSATSPSARSIPPAYEPPRRASRSPR
jgi:hypothetical protein